MLGPMTTQRILWWLFVFFLGLAVALVVLSLVLGKGFEILHSVGVGSGFVAVILRRCAAPRAGRVPPENADDPDELEESPDHSQASEELPPVSLRFGCMAWLLAIDLCVLYSWATGEPSCDAVVVASLLFLVFVVGPWIDSLFPVRAQPRRNHGAAAQQEPASGHGGTPPSADPHEPD
jgi:hypothetical protein